MTIRPFPNLSSENQPPCMRPCSPEKGSICSNTTGSDCSCRPDVRALCAWAYDWDGRGSMEEMTERQVQWCIDVYQLYQEQNSPEVIPPLSRHALHSFNDQFLAGVVLTAFADGELIDVD